MGQHTQKNNKNNIIMIMNRVTLIAVALLVAVATATPRDIAPTKAAVAEQDDELVQNINTVKDFAERFIQAGQDQDASELISTAMSAFGWASQITEEDITRMESQLSDKVNDFAGRVQKGMEANGDKKFPGMKRMFQSVLDALPEEAKAYITPELEAATKANPMLTAVLPGDASAATGESKKLLDAVVALADDWLDMSMHEAVPKDITAAVEKFQQGSDQGVKACPLLASMGSTFAHILSDVKDRITSFSDFSDLSRDYDSKLAEIKPTVDEQVNCLSPTGKPEDAKVGFLVQQILSLPEVREGVTEFEGLADTINDKMQAFNQVFAAVNPQ